MAKSSRQFKMETKKPHILIFPLPIQGAVNPMLKLAELILLSSDGQIHITFLTTDHVHSRLNLHAKAATRFGAYHASFSLLTFPDGLPDHHPRGGDKFIEMLDAVEAVSHPLLREMMMRQKTNTSNSQDKNPITCIISDGLYHFSLDVGKECGIPVIYFETMSPSCIWVYFCLPQLIEVGHVPFEENEGMEALVTIPGMGRLLRRRDLPNFCRANDPDSEIMIQRIIKLNEQFKNASGFIFNTFEDSEAPLLSYIRSHYPYNMYVVGPLHLHLKEKMLQRETMNATKPSYCSNSLWNEDNTCIDWLNQQPRRSVIFCSFGSQVRISKEQLMEFWQGLVNSGFRFLWVKRPNSVIGMRDDFHDQWHEQIPSDLLKSVKDNGYVVTWAPQEEILSHPSVGGFLTHSGWNSTIESLVAGMPMICWPHYVDQLVVSRYVSHVWKVGLDMKDTCDRFIVENMVKDLMCKRKDEFLKNANALANLAKQSVKNDGTSSCSLDKLIDDIMSFRLPV